MRSCSLTMSATRAPLLFPCLLWRRLARAGLNEGAAGFARGLWELYFYALANVVAWRGVERRLVIFEVRRGAPSALEKAGGADFDGVGQSEGVRLHRRHRRPRGESWAKPDHCEYHRRQSHDVSHRNGGVGAWRRREAGKMRSMVRMAPPQSGQTRLDSMASLSTGSCDEERFPASLLHRRAERGTKRYFWRGDRSP